MSWTAVSFTAHVHTLCTRVTVRLNRF